jgi:hypothetical protein
MSVGEYKTAVGLTAKLNPSSNWKRTDFSYLGTIILWDDSAIGWAWHADGRSIDTLDRGFDLIDFSAEREDAR